jgi:hypothetical protein
VDAQAGALDNNQRHALNTEIIDTVHARRAPMVPVHSSLRL